MLRSLLRCSLALALIAGACDTVMAASPRLSLILPRGVQRGAEHEITFNGSNLADAQEIFFYEPGFEVVKLEATANQVKVTLKVAPDCRLGEHVAQVRTASGISDFRTLYVEALPAVAEKEPNSDFAEPQPITLNSTVDGIAQSEDVDYYVLEAKKGQRIVAEVVGMRLSTALFDPYVAILDSKRFELAASDDTPLAVQDGVAAVIAPEDGQYFIEVRESSYEGNGNCRYRLHVGTFPRPTAVYPAGGKLGEPTEVRFLGDPAGELKQTIALPAEDVVDFGLFATDAGGISPTPNAFRLFEHGNVLEVEPNNEFAQGTPAELPLAFNGIIETDGDVDCFKFAAKKGQVFDVECFARRIRSGLDPVVNLYYADGRGITSNDDSRGPDSYFRFNVPADAEYVIRVTDHLGRGASDFVYRIEFQQVQPSLALSIPQVERYGQYRQQIYVARGNRFGTLMNATRTNFGGELVLENKDLPPGVTVHAEPMPANLASMPVVFEAAADAPIGGKLVDFTARHADETTGIRGRFRNKGELVLGAPGQSLYRWKDVDRLAIAVVEELPFTLEIIEPKVPLVRNGSMQLKIVAHKKEGWDEQISVQIPFRPPGLNAASAINIPKGQTEANYPINAAGNAELKEWKIYALGSAPVNGGNAWASSPLTRLQVAEPYTQFALQRASCEQGQEAQIYCKLTTATPFDGQAVAQLVGMPNKVTTSEIQFNKDSAELTFVLKTDPASPVGKHNLYCQVTITQNGEPIVNNVGSVQLQIDQPLPEPVAKPTTPAPTQVATQQPKPTPMPQAAPAKPLTRLEKLRLAAKQREEERNKAAAEAGGGGE